MEIGVTAASEVVESATAAERGVAWDAEGFGTRPRTDRPHSINLFATGEGSAPDNRARAVDVLVGAGLGAVAMYYLDPAVGAQRRAAIRERIVDAVTMAPDAFEATAEDLRRWVGRALDAKTPRLTEPSGNGGRAEWTPTGRLVASVVGATLTLLAAKRRDAFGAAVGLLGAALLGRGVTSSGTAKRES